MELPREQPPAYGTDTRELRLPSVPTTDLPSNAATRHPGDGGITLPDMRSLGLPEAQPKEHWHAHARQNGVLNSKAFPAVPTTAPSSAPFTNAPWSAPRDVRPGSPMATTESVLSSDDRGARAPSVMSTDDKEAMMAAEALSGLRNPDFIRSPSARSTSLHTPHRPEPLKLIPQSGEDGEEPLLSLVTANHPWLGGTISGSVTAYNATKYYSPSFVRNGAEFVERKIGSPIASTMRITGVEAGVRRYLGDRRPSDLGSDHERRRKRLRETSPENDIEKGLGSPTVSLQERRSRAGSQASFVSLPPYDENKSPRYEELAPIALQDPATRQPLSPSRNWRTQLMITTSGLGAALSETSLKNLRYCLRLLRAATANISTMMVALRKLLADYEDSIKDKHGDDRIGSYTLTQEQENASSRIADAIKAAHNEIMRILEQIKNSISHYAGSALPENAGALVRRQLMSIPQRWRVAESTAEQQAAANATETAKHGNKIVVFAGQSLDMLAQVTMVVGATIENAEGWLERMGKNNKRTASALASPALPGPGREKDERIIFGSSAALVGGDREKS